MTDKNNELATRLLELAGGKDNVLKATHCMTRLRLNLKDYDKADIESIKKTPGVLSCLNSGGQLQIVIGTTVSDVYKEFIKISGVEELPAIDEDPDAVTPKGFKAIVDRVFGFLSGTMTKLIPIMIAASLCKTITAVFGPTLLNIMPAESDMYTLFTFMGDAGFYFIPIFLASFAAEQLNVSKAIAMLLAAIMIHPTFVSIAAQQLPFTVYGIPCNVQNYASTVLPIILVVWIMSYVEKFFAKISPKVLKVILVPFGTLIVMTPLALCVLGPAGAFIGSFVCQGIIGLYNVAGPLAVAVLGTLFSLLVLTGMHQLLFVYLFTTFPMLGYDSFMLPGILACSWAGTGVALAALLKFKKKENKSMIAGFIMTWFLGGVGEPMLYGLNLRYRTTLYASMIAGAIAGFVAGLLKLTAYVLNPSNGVYGISAFLGGPRSNYIALIVTIAVALISGFVVMMMMPLKEEE